MRCVWAFLPFPFLELLLLTSPLTATQIGPQPDTSDERNFRHLEKDKNGQEASRGGGSTQSQGSAKCCWQEFRYERKRSGKSSPSHLTLYPSPFLHSVWLTTPSSRVFSSNTTRNGSKTKTKATSRTIGTSSSTGGERRKKTLRRRHNGSPTSLLGKAGVCRSLWRALGLHRLVATRITVQRCNDYSTCSVHGPFTSSRSPT